MAKDRLDRKIEETLSLRRRRNDRRDPDISGFRAPHRTGDQFAAKLFENEHYNGRGVLTEQPMPNDPPMPEQPAPQQDVIVPPDDAEGKPVPGVDVPDETDEKDPDAVDTSDPESQIEEQKRALFNTLSELIDLGRVERSEADIRKYCEEHEDEIGDLLDVLDDVIEMLVMEGGIYREPDTFDDEDEDEVESTPGQKDYDELKPGVGGQVSKGISNTTVIASDQTLPTGQSLSENMAVSRLISGESIEAVLDSAMSEEVVELSFKTPEEREMAVKRMSRVDVPSTNIMKIGDNKIQLVRDDRNRADVEQQMAALQGVDFQQSGSTEVGAATEQDDSYTAELDNQLDSFEGDDIGAMTEVWQELAFAQGDEATEILDIIESQGPEAALNQLADMGYTDMEGGEESNDAPWGEEDEVYHDDATGLTLNWNSRLGYWGLQRKISGEEEAQEFGPAESVNEQVNINRTGIAVQVAFSNEKQSSAARGALLQYKGIDTVVTADEHNIVVFTTDTDPEEARKRVEVILNNARIPIESVQVDEYEQITEAGEEPLGFRYGGADLLPAPVPVGHGTSGADEQQIGQDYGRCPRCGKSLNSYDVKMGKCASCFKDLPQQQQQPQPAAAATEDDVDPDNPSGRDYPGEIGGDTSKEYNGFPIWNYYVDEVIETLPVSDDDRAALLSTSKGQDAYEMRLEEIWDELSDVTKDSIVQAYKSEFGKEDDDEGEAILGGESVAEQAGPVATPDEQKYLIPYHSPDDEVPDEEPPPEGEPAEGEPPPEGEPADELDAEPGDDTLWRMDVPEDPEDFDLLQSVLDSAVDQGLIANWTHVQSEEEPDSDVVEPSPEPPMPDDMAQGAEPVSDSMYEEDIAVPPVDDEPMPPEMDDLEPMPGEVGEFIAVEFDPETSPEEREAFVDWIESETADEVTGEPGIQVSGWEQLMPDDATGDIANLEPGAQQAEQIVPPAPPEALAHGPQPEIEAETEGPFDPTARHQIKHHVGKIRAPKMKWGEKPEEQPEDLFGDQGQADIDWGAQQQSELTPEIQQLLTQYQAAKKSDPKLASSLASKLKFEMGTLGIDPKSYGISEEGEDDEDLPPMPDVPSDPFDRAYQTAVDQTVGGDASPAIEGCPSPGRKVRSKGRGRGLARGRGRGPMGRPSKA